MINGIIIQRKSNITYKGVEGDNWYLNNKYPEIFEKVFEDCIEKSWYDSEYVDVCNDEKFLREYIKLSKKNGIDYRLLLCETDRRYPNMQDFKGCVKKFLGYDYAYSGGSYYSAVFNDIFLGVSSRFKDFKLNSNGLFQEYEEILNFITERNQIIENGKENLEAGNYIIYKLFEIDKNGMLKETRDEIKEEIEDGSPVANM